MVSSPAHTVDQYLGSLTPDRRAAIARVRDLINARLPRGYVETMQYGMISWIVPPSRLAATYNGQPLVMASLASQKQHMALYLMAVYGNPTLAAWFRSAYRATGKKLDMGKSCLRFKTLEALALDVIGEVFSKVPVDVYVAAYEAGRSKKVRPRPVRAKPARAARAKPAPTRAKPAKPASKRAKPAATRAKPASKRAKPQRRG